MSEKIILFGTDNFAELCWYEFTQNSPYQVAGFTLDRAYMGQSTKFGLPVVPFEELETAFPPGEFKLFLSFGYRKINGLRRDRFLAAKRSGYQFVSHVSPAATVASNVEIGENSLVFEGSVVQAFSKIGNNTIIRSAVHISHHNTIGNHSFIAAGVVTGGNVTVGDQCFLGLGARVRDNLSLKNAVSLAAGSTLLNDAQEGMLYLGTPAKNTGKLSVDVF